MAPRPDATSLPGWPASIITFACTTPPAAPPPGRIFAAALPASWAVAVVPQPSCGTSSRASAGASASLVSHHSETSRPSWRPNRTKNQGTSTSGELRPGREHRDQARRHDVEADAGDGQADRATTPALDERPARGRSPRQGFLRTVTVVATWTRRAVLGGGRPRRAVGLLVDRERHRRSRRRRPRPSRVDVVGRRAARSPGRSCGAVGPGHARAARRPDVRPGPAAPEPAVRRGAAARGAVGRLGARTWRPGCPFAQDHDLPIAIRSGGHSYPGWSGGGTPRALVIDCRPLDRVRLERRDRDRRRRARRSRTSTTRSAAGAARSPAGPAPTVGIGGLTLGGGVGVLTRAMGLTCDAVRSMQVVTADGTAPHRERRRGARPLLGAARRRWGTPRRGDVVRLRDGGRADAQHRLPASGRSPPPRQVIEAWQRLGADRRRRGCGRPSRRSAAQTHPGAPTLLLSGTWTGPTVGVRRPARRAARPRAGADVRSTHTRSYLDAMQAFAGSGAREAFAATSHVAYDALDAAGIGDLLDQVQAAQSSGLKEAGISIDALGGKVRDLAPDDTAFVHREALATVQYTATFPPGTAEAPPTPTSAASAAAMLPHWGNHAYVNYADATITTTGGVLRRQRRPAAQARRRTTRRVLHPAAGLLRRSRRSVASQRHAGVAGSDSTHRLARTCSRRHVTAARAAPTGCRRVRARRRAGRADDRRQVASGGGA